MAFGALGLPSVVIMALNAGHASSAPALTTPSAGTPAGAADAASGRRLYSQICVSCHGPDGNLIGDHKLSSLPSRLDEAATVSYIKDPKPPMPKLYPGLLNEQNVADVAAYVRQEFRQ
jgi:mono/diheme cytochrome c family protein